MKRLCDVLAIVLILALVALAVLLPVPKLMGLQAVPELSGAMEPALPKGSLVYAKKTNYRTLQPGDVICYLEDASTFATRRITEVVPDEENPNILRFRTQGDAPDAADTSLVYYPNIIGQPAYFLPGFGSLAAFFLSVPGTILALALALTAAVLFILARFLPGRGRKARSSRRKKGKFER